MTVVPIHPAALPRISVITPSFNQGRFIGDTIRSVLGQGYPGLEYIIVDGASDDGTAAIVRGFGTGVSTFISEPDRGQADALNKGFRRATGDLLTWINSDDLLAPGALHAVAQAWQRSRADVIAGSVRVFEDATGEVVYQHTSGQRSGPLPLAALLDVEEHWLKGAFFYQPEVVFSRRILELAGGTVDAGLHYSMDFDLWARFAAAGARYEALDQEIAQFRIHPAQKTAATAHYLPELRAHAQALRQRFRLPPRPAAAPDLPPPEMPRPPRIGMLSDYGFAYGAGRAHGRIASALARSGFEVVAAKFSDAVGLERGADIARAARAFAHAKVDAIIVGNLHGVLPGGADLAPLAEVAPVLIVTHDHWWLTGRCAYPMACDRHLFACDAACPTATEYPALPPAQIGPAHASKLRQLADPRIHIAANSRHMHEMVRRALETQHRSVGVGAAERLHRIALGISETDFAPVDRAQARAALGIGADEFVVLAGATALDDRRKGFSHILAACEIAGRGRLRLVLMGHVEPDQRLPWVTYTGYLADNTAICRAFSAADVFIGASLDESLGQVFIEAATCGCPAIGYDVGGVADALVSGETGWLVPRGDVAAIGALLARLLDDRGEAAAMGVRARRHATAHWGLPSMMRSLLPVLRRMLGPEAGVPRAVQFDGRLTREVVWLCDRLWRPLEGYDPEEGPYPQYGVARRLRWQTAPVGEVEICVLSAGCTTIAVEIGNLAAAQQVAVTIGGQALGPVRVEVMPWTRLVRLVATIELPAGTHRLRIEASAAERTAEGRALHLALFAVAVIHGGAAALPASEAGEGVRVSDMTLPPAGTLAPDTRPGAIALPQGSVRDRGRRRALTITPGPMQTAGMIELMIAAGPELRAAVRFPRGGGVVEAMRAAQDGEFAALCAMLPPGSGYGDAERLRIALTRGALAEAMEHDAVAIAVLARMVSRALASAPLRALLPGMPTLGSAAGAMAPAVPHDRRPEMALSA